MEQQPKSRLPRDYDPKAESAETRRQQIAYDKKLREVVNYLMDRITAPESPLDSETLRTWQAAAFHFPELREAVDRQNSRHNEPKFDSLRRSILGAALVQILNLLTTEADDNNMVGK
jgi:hypothetical protein